jgi:hypothetical protein
VVRLGQRRSILAACQPSSCRPTTDRGCKAAFKEPPLTAESGGATRAALLAMRAHRGTGSSNPLPSTEESASRRVRAVTTGVYAGEGDDAFRGREGPLRVTNPEPHDP